MKKNIIYLTLVLFSFTVSSCQEDVEVWDSNTLSYSGTYFWELLSEDMADTYQGYDSDVQLLIYNTSENTENEVWIEDTKGKFPLKSKFSLEGTSASFMSKSMDFADLTNNVTAIEDEKPSIKPTALNQEEVVDVDYIRTAILDGKILSKAGTTVSGHAVDSIYIKIKLYSGTVKYTSYVVPLALRADPEVEEFAWEYNSATYNATLDKTYVISGFRKTGFSEDDPH